MKNTIWILIFLGTLTSLSFGADENPTLLRHTKTVEYKYDFYVLTEHKKIKYHDTVSYYWFRGQKIHRTQGSSDGDILNGKFSKFYHSGQLAEQGEFDLGLKEGTWRTWFESGVMSSIYSFDDGILNGDFIKYDSLGNIAIQGNYKKGRLHGEFFNFITGDTSEYKKGKLQVAPKPESVDKQEKVRKGGFLKRLFSKKGSKEKESKKKEPKEKKEKKNWLKKIFSKKEKSEKPPKNKKKKECKE